MATQQKNTRLLGQGFSSSGGNARLLGQGFPSSGGNTRLLGQGFGGQEEKSYADTLRKRIENYETRFDAIGQEPPEVEKKKSLLLKTLDIIDRPRNAIVNAIQDTSTGENGVWQGLKEGFTGKEHAYVSDLLPEDMNKYAKGGLGFVGDVLLDPLTYLTVGAGGVVKGAATGGAKAVAKGGGKKMLKFAGQEIAGSEKIIDPIAKWTGRVLDATGIPDAIGTALQPGYIAGKASKTVDQIKDIGKAQDLTRFSQQRAKGQVDSFVNAGDIDKVKNIPVETRELITDILEMPTQELQKWQGIINKPGFRRSFPESDMTRREITKSAESTFVPNKGINLYRGYASGATAKDANLTGIQSFDEMLNKVIGKESDALYKPLDIEYYTESQDIARKYANQDVEMLNALIKQKGSKDEALKSFEILTGRKPVGEGTVQSHTLFPEKTLDLSDLGEYADTNDLIRRIMDIEGSDWLRDRNRFDEIYENFIAHKADEYGENIFPWKLLRNIDKDDTSAHKFMEWLKQHDYDSVKYASEGTNHHAVIPSEKMFQKAQKVTKDEVKSARPPFRESDSINAFKTLTPQGDLRQATNEGIGRLGKVIDEAKLPEQTGLFADDIKVKNSRGQTISAAKLASLDDNVVQLKSQLDEMVDNQLTKLNQEWDVTGKHSKDGGQRAFSGWDEGFNMQASLTKGLQSKFGGKANQSRMKALARESLEKGYKSIDGDILPDEAYLALKKQYDEAHKVAFDTAKERVSAAKKANKQGRNQLLKSLEADYASKIKPKPKALDQGALFEYEKALPKIRNSMSQVFKSIDAGDFDAIDQTLIKEIADALPDKQASEFMEAVTKGIKDGKVSKDAKGKLYKDAYVASKFGKEQASLKQIINIAESKLGRELTEQEVEGIELITKMRAETMLKDIKAGVEFDPLPNYIRHLYENPPEQIRELKNEYVKRIAALNPKGGFQKQRSFDTIKDFEDFAREQGVELIAKKDAGLLAVVREMEGISQRVIERTYKQILNMGDNVVQDAATAPTDWVKLPIKGFEGKAIEPNVAREITRSHQIFSSEEGINGLFKTLDTVQNIWKGLVTTSVPFHIRNSMGNTYNNFLAGVVNPNLYPMAWAIQNDSTGKWVLNGAEYTGNEIMDLFRQQGLEGFGIFKGESINTKIKQAEDVLGVNKPGFNMANPISADFAPVKGSRWLGDKIETNAKLAHFIDKITKGYSPEEAAQSVRKYLFDYADLTPTEEKIKKVIPFYTWTRKNIPLQIESLITQPGKPTAVSKLVQNMRNTQGTEDSDMPDWMNDEMAIPIYVNDEGNQVYLMPDLPIANLNMFGGGETMRNMMGMLTPLAKVPMEIGMNQQIFTGAPIEQYEGAQSQVGGVSMPSKAAYALGQFGSMPRTALSMAGGIMGQQPSGDSLIPPAPQENSLDTLLFGGLTRQIDPKRQEIFNLMDRDSQLADFRKLLEDVYGIDVPTINEIKKGQ